MHHLKQVVNDWDSRVLDKGGYWAVALLMAIECTFLPVPREIIIPPAVYKAWSGDGLAFFGTRYSGWPAEIMLVLTGAIGSWIGAALMYWITRTAGRPLVLRYGRYFLMSPEKV